jgi:predicted transcriptional regulator
MSEFDSAVSAAPKRKRPLKSYPMEPDLIAGLARLARREHLPVAALVRRAIRRELEREGVLTAEWETTRVSEVERRTKNAKAGRLRARTRKRPSPPS